MNEQQLMDAALDQAQKSFDEGGLPIGSVLYHPGQRQIVAAGHNERVQSGDPTAHAEVVCIRRAGRRTDWRDLTLVSTLSPCIMCTGTALLLKIPRLIVGENQTFRGAEHLFAEAGVEVTLLNDPRCIELMRRVQRERPGLWAEDIGEAVAE
jgi:cytosine deaminase